MRKLKAPSAYRLSQSLICILILGATWSIWLPKGYLVFSDLDFGLDDSMYLDRIFGLFNQQFSSTNFFNLSRLAFTVVPYWLSLLFNGSLPHFLLRSIVVICLLLSGLGMFKLIERLIQWHFGNFRLAFHYYALIIPSLFYALNPWVIIRLQHIFLVVGYAFYPLVLYFFLLLFDDKFPVKSASDGQQDANTGTRSSIFRGNRQLHRELYLSVALAFCISLGSAAIHYFFYYAISMALLVIALLTQQLKLNRNNKRRVWLQFARKLGIALPIVFLFIAYWLVPYFASSFFLNIEPQNVNVADTLSLFSRYSNIKQVLYLASYWWPMFNTAKTLDTYFWISGGVFLVLIAYTVFYRYSWHYYVKLFTWLAVISLLVALGTNTNIISDVNVYVVTKIPLVGQIFRDPNKLIGPMALFFSVLIGFGIDKIVYSLKRSGYGGITQILFLAVLFMCIFLYYRPFYTTYTANYYAGREVPQAYHDVQSQYKPGGKILWTPVMGNMLLSNGLSSYDWNVTDSELKLKASGDFHMYSSAKPTITTEEGNTGAVSYFHSFLQYLLDWGGAQHLGTLLSWAGFNELGYHQDVFGQEERQNYNLQVLTAQKDISLRYDQSPLKLFDLPAAQPDLAASNRAVYAAKGLDSIMSLLDYQKELNLNPSNTALFWATQRLQQVPLQNSDLLIGDSKEDLLFPQLDPRYFYFPFDEINSGNPYTDWAKTLMKTSDWNWLLKSNNLNANDWNYDFGKGIAYTYSSQRLLAPPHKADELTGKPLVTMKDVINDFFIPGNSGVLKLHYTPKSLTEDSVVSGTVLTGGTQPQLWETAQSKLISFEGKSPSFLHIRAVVSGINAGQMHFKIKFFDEKLHEVSVAYVSKDTADSEFSKALMSNNTAVPIGTKYMRVDLLASNDTKENVYFYIHDFQIDDISAETESNKLEIPVRHDKLANPSDEYRVFIRLFRSQVGDVLQLGGADRPVDLVTKGTDNRFIWMDAGNMHIPGALSLIPRNGLNVVNTVVAIPQAEYDTAIQSVLNKMSGAQADIGTVINDYQIDTPVSFQQLHDIRTSPNSLMNSLTPITSGTLTKSLDLLHDENYQFVFTGNIPNGSVLNVTLIDSNGSRIPLSRLKNDAILLPRNLSGFYNRVQYVNNKYFLNLTQNVMPGWDVYRYDYEAIPLKQGKYTVEIKAASNTPNLSRIGEAHLLGEDEIHVPESLVDEEQNLLTYFIMNRDRLAANKTSLTADRAEFVNQRTPSLSWFIVSMNSAPVKKGQLIVWKAQVQGQQVKNLHAKMMFTDLDHNLLQSVYAQTTETDNNGKDIYLVVEAPADGLMQPALFYNGLKDAEGRVTVDDSQLYVVDDLVKLESTAWLPTGLAVISPAPATLSGNPANFKVNGGRFVLFNEVYNPIWRLSGDGNAAPLAANLLHNAYTLKTGDAAGSITLMPVLRYIYTICLVISAAAHVLALWIWTRYRLLYNVRFRKRPVDQNEQMKAPPL